VNSVIVTSALAAEGTGAAAVLPPSGKVYVGVTVDGTLGVVPELDTYTGSAGGKRPSVIMVNWRVQSSDASRIAYAAAGIAASRYA
jgi:hypothetical protein